MDATDINNDGTQDNHSDFLNGQKISLWADRSGNNNSPVEANETRMATWVERDASLFGKPVVSFDQTYEQRLTFQKTIIDPSMIVLVTKRSSQESRILGGDLQLTKTDFSPLTLINKLLSYPLSKPQIRGIFV